VPRAQDDLKSQEPWEKVAEQVSKEQDPKKLTELANLLIEKLDKATKRRRPEEMPTPDKKRSITGDAA
jgi:hypothetical protein